ncbi:GNAT family N-acetyltransferase [Clostridium thermarum]|uniref:GNAT family N-acetyltransferase n=1 Tax=Clostridium thermarum TaxID=1716543 RepID=UPI0013D8A432|nr:GNAT family protein [Clostridium thermarum]
MIKLELMKEEDFSKVVQWNKGKSKDFLVQWAGPALEYPLTEDKLREFFKEYNMPNETSRLLFKIILENSGEMVGIIEIRKYEKESNTGRVGRFLIGEETVRGKGIGAAALREVVRMGFEKLKYDKICLGVFDFNKSAIVCYKKVGFQIDRLTEKYVEVSDGYWNLYDMSISKANFK